MWNGRTEQSFCIFFCHKNLNNILSFRVGKILFLPLDFLILCWGVAVCELSHMHEANAQHVKHIKSYAVSVLNLRPPPFKDFHKMSSRQV